MLGIAAVVAGLIIVGFLAYRALRVRRAAQAVVVRPVITGHVADDTTQMIPVIRQVTSGRGGDTVFMTAVTADQ